MAGNVSPLGRAIGTCDVVDAADPVPGGLVDASAGAANVGSESPSEDTPCTAGPESLALASPTADNLRTD